MKIHAVPLLLTALLIAGPCTATDMLAPTATESERIDAVIQQNQMLTEIITDLRRESERPKTKEEAFVACMQAAKGSKSAMAAESIGGHCDQLLKP